MDKKKYENILLVFTRLPVAGEVKTRLIPKYGSKNATSLYLTLINHTFEIARLASFDNVRIMLTSNDSDNEYLNKWKKNSVFDFENQSGTDLGERMYYAFQRALDRFSRVVLIGCDCPGLTVDDLIEARNMLEEKDSCVMGPSEDGGYYLIGLNRCEPELFRDINWGNENVAEITRRKVKNLGLNLFELEEKWDVDRPEDVDRLMRLWPEIKLQGC